MQNTRTFVMIIGLAVVAAACGKSGDACAELKQKVAKSTGAAVDKVGPLIDKELTGPSGEALAGDQRAAACKMIVSDKEALEGYTASIKAQLP
ncbi:MAG: hypothetical protein WKG01_24020 [Kofleriaceae bacterium]